MEKFLSKIIPDFFSYWTIFRAIIVVTAAFLLITIQREEQEEATREDASCLNLYKDIHYSKWYGQQPQGAAQGQAA